MKMGMSASWSFVLLPICWWISLPHLSSCVDIRMVDGVDRNPSPPASETQSGAYQAPKREPRAAEGPRLLLGLRNECFQTVEANYEYSICMFANVTQRRVTDRLKVGLGVWERWHVSSSLADGGSAFVMKYTDGDNCLGGESSRSTEVHIACDAEDFAVSNVKEASTCQYEMDLSLPIPCALLERELGLRPSHNTSTAAPTESAQQRGDGGGGAIDGGQSEADRSGSRFLGGWLSGLTNRGGGGGGAKAKTGGFCSSSTCRWENEEEQGAPSSEQQCCQQQRQHMAAAVEELVQEVASLKRQLAQFAEEERTAMAELRSLVVSHVHISLPQAAA